MYFYEYIKGVESGAKSETVIVFVFKIFIKG